MPGQQPSTVPKQKSRDFVKHRNLGACGPGHTVHLSLLAEVFQEHTGKCVCVCVCVCTALSVSLSMFMCVHVCLHAPHIHLTKHLACCWPETMEKKLVLLVLAEPPTPAAPSPSQQGPPSPQEVLHGHGVAAPSAHPSPLEGNSINPGVFFSDTSRDFSTFPW